MVIQFLAILGAYLIGNGIVTWLSLPIPGSMVGAILLFIALILRVFKLEWVEKVAQWHMKHMILLVIPSIVGIIQFTGIFQTEGIQLMMILMISSLILFFVTAYIAEFYQRKERGEQNGKSDS
jgi:holin-like protein